MSNSLRCPQHSSQTLRSSPSNAWSGAFTATAARSQYGLRGAQASTRSASAGAPACRCVLLSEWASTETGQLATWRRIAIRPTVIPHRPHLPVVLLCRCVVIDLSPSRFTRLPAARLSLGRTCACLLDRNLVGVRERAGAGRALDRLDGDVLYLLRGIV